MARGLTVGMALAHPVVEFADELDQLRISSGLSYGMLSSELGCPRSTINGWIKGRNLPYPRHEATFEALLVLFGVTDTEAWLRRLRWLRGLAENGDGDNLNPYQGLQPFTEADRDRYFGRDDSVAWLRTTIAESAPDNPPILVVGASGSGKTSLVRAGLLGSWDRDEVDYVVPDDDLGTWSSSVLASAASRSNTRLVVIDQFERIFAQSKWADCVADLENVRRVVELPGVIAVISLRADCYEQTTGLPWLRSAPAERQLVVGPLPLSQLTDAILGPARGASLEISPDLLVRLVTDCIESASSDGATSRAVQALPLLSDVLFRLADERTGSLLTTHLYERIGGIEGALKESAERAYGDLDTGEQVAADLLLTSLAEVDLDGAITARRPSLVELESSDAGGGEMRRVIERFAAARLIFVDATSVMLSHEALFRAGSRFADVVESRLEQLVMLRHVSQRCRLWADSGCEPGDLLTGALLDAAEVAIGQTSSARLAELDREFVADSLAARNAAVVGSTARTST